VVATIDLVHPNDQKSGHDRTMAARRQLAILIWTAIVVIAVQLMPSVAWAHAGHDHGPVATLEQAAASDEARLTAQHASTVAGAEMTETVVTAADTRRSLASSRTCHATCCGSGFSCSVPVLVAEMPPYLPGRPSARAVVRAAAPLPDGIDPETLPKPPKSFS
jgi:hypothetical protein